MSLQAGGIDERERGCLKMLWAVYNGNIHDPESKCIEAAWFRSYLDAEKYLHQNCNGALWSIVGVEDSVKGVE